MGRKNKEKAQFSLSADVYDYIQKYAKCQFVFEN